MNVGDTQQRTGRSFKGMPEFIKCVSVTLKYNIIDGELSQKKIKLVVLIAENVVLLTGHSILINNNSFAGDSHDTWIIIDTVGFGNTNLCLGILRRDGINRINLFTNSNEFKDRQIEGWVSYTRAIPVD